MPRSAGGMLGKLAGVVLLAVGALVAVSPAPPTGADGNEAPGNPFAFRSITAGNDHACALVHQGTVKCWGYNGNGQLGLGDTANRGEASGEMGDDLPAVSLGADRTATALTAGSAHTCALLDDATVKCWGFNDYGPLGLGDTAQRGDAVGEMGDNLPAVDLGTGRTATAITAGQHNNCALLDDATVKCWGSNDVGQLGLGDIEYRGDADGEMGDDLPAVGLGTGRTATTLAAGYHHTCALLDDATVKCWGSNGNGQLGLGDTDSRGHQLSGMGDNLPTVSLGTGRTATAIAAGSEHTCALLDDARVKCWGDNDNGQLGLGDTSHRGDGAGEMGDDLPAVNLGAGRTATAITAASEHTCALLDDASVKCWGYNDEGQLGLGDTSPRGDGAGEMGDDLPAVSLGAGRTATVITAGQYHTCARLDNATIKCWGLNSAGQLGVGDTDNRGDAGADMGNSLPPVDLGSASAVSGTVTDAVSGAPVSGAFVAVLRTTDFSLAGGAVADGSGNYRAAVAPGSYFVYVIDATGAHAAGFFGPPTMVTVPVDTVVDADPTMAPTRGSISGRVIDDTDDTPIANAMVVALTNGGVAEIATFADNNGDYTLGGLHPGNHYVGFVDPNGNHRSEFWPNSLNVPDATTVAVTAGATTVADSELSSQSGTSTGSLLTGTVVETGTLTPLDEVVVLALHAGDFRLARAAITNSAGEYSLDVQAGAGYKLAYVDRAGVHGFEWHDNQPNTGLGTASTVVAPAVTNAALDNLTGAQAGTITDETSGDPIDGAWVFAIAATGLAGGAVTAPDGTYTITGLAPGTYRATIVDPNGGRAQEYFQNSVDYDGATPFNITAGTTTPNINAAVGQP